MKALLRTTLLLVVIVLAGCVDKKPHDFFATSGITVGDPVLMEAGTYRIPTDFETKIVHSGQWIDSIQAEIVGSDIQITAIFTHANHKSRYPGYIEVAGARAGVYTLQYRDPDGALHRIKSVTLPKKNSAKQ